MVFSSPALGGRRASSELKTLPLLSVPENVKELLKIVTVHTVHTPKKCMKLMIGSQPQMWFGFSCDPYNPIQMFLGEAFDANLDEAGCFNYKYTSSSNFAPHNDITMTQPIQLTDPRTFAALCML